MYRQHMQHLKSKTHFAIKAILLAPTLSKWRKNDESVMHFFSGRAKKTK